MTNIVEEGRQQKIRIGRIGGIQYMQGCMVILNVISPSNRGHINLENGNRGESKPETPSCNQRVSDFRIYLLGEVGAHFMHGAHKNQILSVKVLPSRAPGRGLLLVHAFSAALDGLFIAFIST